MSATLRFDVGFEAARAIAAIRGNGAWSAVNGWQGVDILDHFGAKQAERWAGAGRPTWVVTTIGIKLPKQIGEAWQFLKTTAALSGTPLISNSGVRLVGGVARKSCWTIAKKLVACLGVPTWLDFDHNGIKAPQIERPEWPFLQSIDADPGNEGPWLVYADWLEEHAGWLGEHNEDDARRRCNLIRALFGPRKVKTKYGIPLMARKERRS